MVIAGEQQQPNGFNRRSAEHHQPSGSPLDGSSGGIDEQHALGLILRGIEQQLRHQGTTAQRHPAGGQGCLQRATLR